ncbi:MAG: Vitamin B12 import ATP-binding protein BtuD [Acidimicrobiales bacterium]|nr:MAG: ATP-binding cassette domain-containing protein [Actinomycetota bacterium]MBV6507764.1 Vitamin B12 import ATP-binding protein BtuD [Acidimicrobiales bacterium]RIK05923.1 MAG: daunorubicin ABC transporter ATP-binding protein [Acidobacteriota bacterium]
MTRAAVQPIEAEALVRCFDEIRAVDGIDIVVDKGEIFGFLGPNGAGKSTAVRVLTTLLKPTSGTARVAGYDVESQADKVREVIGVALQDAAIDPLMTGKELLRLQATLHGIPRRLAARRAKDLLERVGLTEAAPRLVGQYSGGMRRRLDLALALMNEPDVLFLDEPTTGLDPMSRRNLWEEVRRLNREYGTTVFLTTQYLEEADQLANRIAIIDHGKIVREGDPAALKKSVGSPTLRVDVADEQQAIAEQTLQAFGEERPSRVGRVSIGLEGGAERMADVVRALDEAGIVIEHMELDSPSLDDVFADATGRRLEGAADAEEPAE